MTALLLTLCKIWRRFYWHRTVLDGLLLKLLRQLGRIPQGCVLQYCFMFLFQCSQHGYTVQTPFGKRHTTMVLYTVGYWQWGQLANGLLGGHNSFRNLLIEWEDLRHLKIIPCNFPHQIIHSVNSLFSMKDKLLAKFTFSCSYEDDLWPYAHLHGHGCCSTSRSCCLANRRLPHWQECDHKEQKLLSGLRRSLC